MDGSFSAGFDSTARTSATILHNFAHLTQESKCHLTTNITKWDNSTVCDSDLKLRKVMFNNLDKKNEFKNTPMKVQLIDSVDEDVP